LGSSFAFKAREYISIIGRDNRRHAQNAGIAEIKQRLQQLAKQAHQGWRAGYAARIKIRKKNESSGSKQGDSQQA